MKAFEPKQKVWVIDSRGKANGGVYWVALPATIAKVDFRFADDCVLISYEQGGNFTVVKKTMVFDSEAEAEKKIMIFKLSGEL